MVTEKLKKFVAESRYYRFDFTKQVEMTEGETLTGSPTVVSTPAGLTLGAITLDSTSKKVIVLISSGALGQTYELTVTVTTSDGSILVDCGQLLIVDC